MTIFLGSVSSPDNGSLYASRNKSHKCHIITYHKICCDRQPSSLHIL